MKFQPVTIKDIAQALNLSVSTVSRALRDSYEISEETKRLVTEYAEKANYRPNPVALSLKERRTRSLGIVVSEIANSFFSQAINGIESVAHKRGYTVIITQTSESSEREIQNIRDLASRSVDGLLISLSCETTDVSYMKDVHEMGVPMVFFDRVPEEIDTHKVISDNYRGAYDATLHLIRSGYERIAFLGNAPHLSIIKERLAGYADAHRDCERTVDETLTKYCLHGGLIYSEAVVALDALMSLSSPPDAVLACADKLTTSCLKYCKESGIRVPEEVALVGFSNLDLTDLLSPSLSVIRQSAFEIGQQATELVLELIESKRPVTKFETRSLPSQLFIRETTGVKKGRATKRGRVGS